jgi:hypothetical protein
MASVPESCAIEQALQFVSPDTTVDFATRRCKTVLRVNAVLIVSSRAKVDMEKDFTYQASKKLEIVPARRFPIA